MTTILANSTKIGTSGIKVIRSINKKYSKIFDSPYRIYHFNKWNTLNPVK